MCFKTPKAPAVKAAPTRDSIQTKVQDQRRRLASQTGQYGDIFTSALGDSSYGQSAVKQVAAYGQVA